MENAIAEQNKGKYLPEEKIEELLQPLTETGNDYKDEEMSLYPDWTGTTERLENGERYIYQTAFDEERQEIIYTKIEYSTNRVIKNIVVDVRNKTIVQP